VAKTDHGGIKLVNLLTRGLGSTKLRRILMGLSKPAAERRRGKAGVVDRVKGDEDSRLDGCIQPLPGGKFPKVRPRQRDTLRGVSVFANYALDFFLQVDIQIK
jgi:hypothetical protein